MNKFILIVLLNFVFNCHSQNQLPKYAIISYGSCDHSVSSWKYSFETDSMERSCNFQFKPYSGYKDTIIYFPDRKIMRKIAKRIPKDMQRVKSQSHGIHQKYLRIEIIYDSGFVGITFEDHSLEENLTQLQYEWRDISLITSEYDSEADIKYHNYNDALRNGKTVIEIERLLIG